MERIRAGIIGTGNIAQTAHLPLLSRMPDFELVGVCDSQRTRMKGIADQYGVAIRSTDYAAFVNNPAIEAIVISTPTDTHYPVGMAALQAGKHVLIEKPLARTYREAAELSELAAQKGKVLMVGMNHRFRLDTSTLKNFIASGEIGSVYMVNAAWHNYRSSSENWAKSKSKSGGGVFIDLGIVLIDLVLWLLDYPTVASVSAAMYRQTMKDVEDAANAFVRLGKDTSLQMEVSWTAPGKKPEYGIDFIGTKGSAGLNPFRINKIIAGSPVIVTPELPETGMRIFKKSYEHELRHFAGGIRGLHPVVSTGTEAAHRMKLVEAAYQSAESHKEVYF